MDKKTRIVLFEDNVEVSSNLIEILEIAGYEVILLDCEVNLKESISLINPDLILSDIMMPKKDGIEILSELKRHKEFLDIPFIFLTAKTSYDELREGMNIGADDYIFKPFNAKDLLRSISLRLEKANLLKEKIDAFSNNIAIHIPHEMRTPLVSLLGYSSLILDDYKSLTESDILAFTERINFSAKRLHRTIEKFIQYSNLVLLELDKDDRNTFLFGKRNNEVKDIALTAISKVNSTYKRETDLQVNLDDFSSKLSELALSTIFYELTDNALKYSENGTEVKINGTVIDDKYFVEIEDNGKGISETELKILDDISKLEPFKRNRFEMGFGLAIVRKMLNYLGEDLKIDSKVDTFTKISFKIL